MAKSTYLFVFTVLVTVSFAFGLPVIMRNRPPKLDHVIHHRSHRTGELPTAGCQVYTTIRQCQTTLPGATCTLRCQIMNNICKAALPVRHAPPVRHALPVRHYNCKSSLVKCYVNTMETLFNSNKNYPETSNGVTQFLVDLGKSQNCSRRETG
ncbi:uncharacterized protein [Haliotis cracherodii]|uniref:uncharacterized protein n=1 Tax=Haliotis cracherodii TaxID=6455 RepID=UPI0039E9A602